jgi:hypothetical protein
LRLIQAGRAVAGLRRRVAAGKAPERNESKEYLIGPHLFPRISKFACRLRMSDWLSVNERNAKFWRPDLPTLAPELNLGRQGRRRPAAGSRCRVARD